MTNFSEEKSRTQIKQEATELQKLGERLISLTKAQLLCIDIPKELFDAIILAKSISTNKATRRQKQYIGALMRQIDLEPVLKALKQIEDGLTLSTGITKELKLWQKKILQKPAFSSQLIKALQDRFNRLIPQKMHKAVTFAIKNMVKGVLAGSEFITKKTLEKASLEERENLVKKKLGIYKKMAIATGAGTGAGGFLLGLADFPILLSIKMKFLFDVASVYGFDVKNYKERLYILYIFQLAFSSREKGKQVYKNIKNWNESSKKLPESIEDFNWQSFQQEYRDYIDLLKLFQLIPGFGAIVGAYANYRFMEKLAVTATNAYRMRILNI